MRSGLRSLLSVSENAKRVTAAVIRDMIPDTKINVSAPGIEKEKKDAIDAVIARID